MTVRLFCHLMRREQHPLRQPSPNFSREWRQVRPLSSVCPKATTSYAVLYGRCLFLVSMLLHMPCNNIRWTIGRCWTVAELWRLRIYACALDLTISTGRVLLRPSKFRDNTSHDVTTECCHIFCNSFFTDNTLNECCLIWATDRTINKLTYSGARGGLVVKALRYKPAGRGFDSRWCHSNFSVT